MTGILAAHQTEKHLINEDLSGYKSLKAYVVSDIHLNNHPYDSQFLDENPRRRNFRIFLNTLNREIEDTDKVYLIFNGDILDITGSWFEPVMPWDGDRPQVQQRLCELLLEIMENNLATFQELRNLLKRPNIELIYIFGNHDGLLQKFPESHQIIRDFLSLHPNVQQRIRFAPFFESEALEFYAEHGHLLDPFNHCADETDNQQPALGDVINILIVNRFVELAVESLRNNGYSEAFIAKMHTRLHDIEYLRPLALVPVWIQTIANQYQSHPENIGKRQSIKTILMDVVSVIVSEPEMIQYMTRQLKLPKGVLQLITTVMLRIPSALPIISFITSKLVRRTHSNKYQYLAAKRINRDKGFRLIAFGHTHIPGVIPLSEHAYYFNTGSWKPVINLFKDPKNPVDLESLNPEVQFNKVECSGILRLEKSNFHEKIPAEFSLQTIQSGQS